MAKEITAPAFEAIAWLDPSVTTHRHSLKLDRYAQPHTTASAEQDSSPSGCGVANAGSDDSEEPQEEEVSRGPRSIGSQKVESPSPGAVIRQRLGRAAAATQFLLLLALGFTVFGVMLYDSRLYHGLDVLGRPMTLDGRLDAGESLDINPISSDSAIGNDEPNGSLVLPGTAFLNRTIPDGSPVSAGDSRDIAAPG